MKKIWMNTIDTLRNKTEAKHAPRHAAEHDPIHEDFAPHDHRMSDRFRPTLSTR